MKLGVCLPSRGLVHSRTLEDLHHILNGTKYTLYMSHDLPIPDCFNKVVDEAMDAKCDYIWMVEEDMKLPKGILKEMLDLNKPIVTANYPVIDKIPTVIDHDGFTQFGTGCLLVKREVFEKMGKPYFRADHLYDAMTFKPVPMHPHAYGGHDIDFSLRLKDSPYKITVTKTKVGQYKIVGMGRENVNTGQHEVQEITL